MHQLSILTRQRKFKKSWRRLIHHTKTNLWLLLTWRCIQLGHHQPFYRINCFGMSRLQHQAGITVILTRALGKQASTIMAWRRHQMETFSALLAICAGNSPVPGEFPTQRPVTRSCDVFFDLRLNKRLSIQSWGWWFEMLTRPLWHQCNGNMGWHATFVKHTRSRSRTYKHKAWCHTHYRM